MINHQLKGRQNARLKDEFRERLPHLIGDIVNAHRKEARQAVDGWFSLLTSALDDYHRGQFDSIAERLADRLDKPAAEAVLLDAEAAQAVAERLEAIVATLETHQVSHPVKEEQNDVRLSS
ncbi:hypothetical protein SD71_06665 [Cohnella kolymensis]|uniref:Uncharacterized protein n=1 Tax=Cohnella kolymensis TaxID=1590652 RepID=A0ABR5A6M9_9BACL|nr:hypothetical protein [Cohnella kolymensis]KIL36679.1 hypothetical protein SD71_06665 [Cohnella kolymensis]